MSNNLLQTTTKDALAKVVATTLKANPLARTLLSKPEVWKGGEKYKQPVKVLTNTNFVTYQGLDLLPTSRTDTVRNMEFVSKNAAINVALANDEMNINASDTSITDLVKMKMQEAALDMAQAVGALFYGNGTGNDFNGLGNIVDDGSVASTIGGLSRSTYTTLQSVVTASGGTLTLDKMVTLFNQISDSGIQPDALYCDKTVNALYEKIAQTLNQYIALPGGTLKYNAGAGSNQLTFKGRPVFIDPKATAQTMYFLNSDFLKWVMVKPTAGMSEAVDVYPDEFEGGVPDADVKGLGFSWSGWRKSYNQMGVNGFITLQGQLIPTSPNRLGKLTGITTV